MHVTVASIDVNKQQLAIITQYKEKSGKLMMTSFFHHPQGIQKAFVHVKNLKGKLDMSYPPLALFGLKGRISHD